MHSVSKHVRLSELTVKIWMKIDLYCQRQRCSLVTLVSVNIRFGPIFKGVHWREGVKRQWGNRKHGFIWLSTLRLQHAKKWDKRYCILLFNPLSPFHWPEIYDLGWLWMAWMFIIRYSIGCGHWAVHAPENVKWYFFSFAFTLLLPASALGLSELNDSTQSTEARTDMNYDAGVTKEIRWKMLRNVI